MKRQYFKAGKNTSARTGQYLDMLHAYMTADQTLIDAKPRIPRLWKGKTPKVRAIGGMPLTRRVRRDITFGRAHIEEASSGGSYRVVYGKRPKDSAKVQA